MTTIVLIAQLAVSQLTPAQAVEILKRSIPDLNRTDIVAVPDDGPVWASTASSPGDGPFGSFGPRPVLRPLNCCGEYRIRLPWSREPHVAKPSERSTELLRPAADVHDRLPKR
jgi:hypothetical protein